MDSESLDGVHFSGGGLMEAEVKKSPQECLDVSPQSEAAVENRSFPLKKGLMV